MLLQNKTAVVTGAARGMGLAIAERLLSEGARVAMIDLDGDELEKVAAKLSDENNSVAALVCDVAERGDVAQTFDKVRESLGTIDILVNNAGIAGRAVPLEEITDDDWEKMMAIDLKSVFLCCQAVIGEMKQRKSGRIVNIASIAGKEGNPNMIPYSSAKAGVIGFTKALAKEVAADNVFVNSIAPAVIETPILKQLTEAQVNYMISKIPLGRTGKPSEVAAMVAWLASEEASFTTGQCFDLSGGRATY